MIMPVSHSLSPRLMRLLNVFGFVPGNDGAGGPAQSAPVSNDADAVTGAEITRARRLLCRIEAVGVRFPAEVHQALAQAEAAYAQSRWTLQVDRGFYSVLGLLESVARLGGAERAASYGCYDADPVEAEQRRWTVIISNRLKVLEGRW